MSETGSRKLRLGLIGYGHWGKILAKTISGSVDFHLSSLGLRRQQENVQVDDSCQIYFSISEFFSESDLDAVVIATPPSTHLDLVKESLSKNWPVYLEKPAFLSPQEHEEAAVLMKNKSQPIMVGLLHLYSSAYKQLKNDVTESLKKGLSIRQIETWGGNMGPFREDYSSLWDYGPHDLSMTLDILGERPTQVKKESIRDENTNINASSHRLRLVFPSGAVANVCVGNNFEVKKRFFKVDLDDGSSFVYDDISDKKYCKISSSGVHEYPILDSTRSLDQSLIEFKRTIENGLKGHPSFEVSEAITKILSQ